MLNILLLPVYITGFFVLAVLLVGVTITHVLLMIVQEMFNLIGEKALESKSSWIDSVIGFIIGGIGAVTLALRYAYKNISFIIELAYKKIKLIVRTKGR